ncbi:MAG: 3-keto-5-aminohexanoate cleavage protein [Alphaproteobacteria bacterium]|nr:3-keto-5-aminohexanoate cleavage protein [Alphaproteobacteria bacterium SS10]
MTPLPSLMVAPNGARRTKADHPALPITTDEIIIAAKNCFAAGADGLHLHIRDAEGKHLLDVEQYSAILKLLAEKVPRMTVQITTEAVGIYDPPAQRAVALESGAELVSVSIREMMREPDEAPGFYAACHERGIGVQHILYDLDDYDLLANTLPKERLTDPALQLIYVLGRYTEGQQSNPEMLTPFLDRQRALGHAPDWAVCAFGQGETDCLEAAIKAGGKCRVGFENSLTHADDSEAKDNAERVAVMAGIIAKQTLIRKRG